MGFARAIAALIGSCLAAGSFAPMTKTTKTA